MKYLADTNVLSELRRPRPHARVRAAIAAIDPRDLYISAMFIGEVANGIARLAGDVKRAQLVTWLDGIEADFVGRILVVDEPIARRWGEITGRLSLHGRVLPVADSLIAATALHHGLTLLTRNVADFADTGIRVLDPWTTPIT